jgi:hypothetical protein
VKSLVAALQTGLPVKKLNEALGWASDGGELLRRAERDLGMTALRPLPPSRSGHYVVIMYRPETLGAPQDYNTDISPRRSSPRYFTAWAIHSACGCASRCASMTAMLS